MHRVFCRCLQTYVLLTSFDDLPVTRNATDTRVRALTWIIVFDGSRRVTFEWALIKGQTDTPQTVSDALDSASTQPKPPQANPIEPR